MTISELDNRPKRHKSNITIADTDAWLAKHGNGMARLPKKAIAIPSNHWGQYGEEPLQKLVDDWFAVNDELVPYEIPNPICCNYVRRTCERMVEAGELVKSTVKRPYDDPIKGKINKSYVVYKKA